MDESGDGVGPGIALNQFYSVYKLTGSVVDIKQQAIPGINNYSVVIVPNGDVPPTLGDANGDGSFDFGDIEAFFLAITDLSAYTAQYPNVLISSLDMNEDGNTDFGDIEAFFLALTTG